MEFRRQMKKRKISPFLPLKSKFMMGDHHSTLLKGSFFHYKHTQLKISLKKQKKEDEDIKLGTFIFLGREKMGAPKFFGYPRGHIVYLVPSVCAVVLAVASFWPYFVIGSSWNNLLLLLLLPISQRTHFFKTQIFDVFSVVFYYTKFWQKQSFHKIVVVFQCLYWLKYLISNV